MTVKGVRSQRREAPAGGVRNSNVVYKDGGLDGESDRAIAARGGSRTVKQEVINLFYGNGTA